MVADKEGVIAHPTIDRRYTSQHEIRLEGDDGNSMPQIRGYASLFNDPYQIRDWFGEYIELIQEGAFTESLKNGDDVRMLFNHNPDLILGRNAAGTLSLGEDAKGLWYSNTPPDTQLGRDIIESLRRGDITQSSFAFEVIEDKWRTNDGQEERTIVRAKLWDVSPVTYPANTNTTSEATKRSHELWQAGHREVPRPILQQCRARVLD